MRKSISAERAAAMFTEAWTINVLDELRQVSAPTLVMHRRHDVTIPFERGRQLAAGIAGAEFLPLEGADHLWYYGDSDAVIDATVGFLGDADSLTGGKVLTKREQAIVELVEQGLSNADIADRLTVSRRTVDAHLEHVRKKLGLRSRAQIAAWNAARRVS
jgi:DNA-binding CsgD family transcriptional regulator